MPPLPKEFVLTHVLENITAMEENVQYFSEEEDYFNVKWKLAISRKNGYFSVFIHCLEPTENTRWSIETETCFRLICVTGKTNERKGTGCFEHYDDKKCRSMGKSKLMKWEELLKDYVVDGTTTVEVEVKILKMCGIKRKKLRNFDKPNQDADLVLKVQNELFYVSYAHLAGYSEYFCNLDVHNSNKPEELEPIVIPIVIAEDFQNFLEVIYGEDAIDDDTVEGIHYWSRNFGAQLVEERCVEFLKNESDMSLRDKFSIATFSHSERLITYFLGKMETMDDLRAALPSSSNLKYLSHSVTTLLLQKAVTLRE